MEARAAGANIETYIQPDQRGTADAVLAAAAALAAHQGDVMVLFADTPLLRPETLVRLREMLEEGLASRCSASRRPIRWATAGC